MKSEKYFMTVIGVIISWILFLNSAGTDDVNSWLKWMNYSSKLGVVEAYRVLQTDYPPLSFAILSLGDLKLVLGLFFIGSMAIFYLWKKEFLTFYLMFILSMILGYLDMFYIPFLIGSLWCAEKKNVTLCMVLFTIACFIKWQPIIILPFLLVYLFEMDYKTILKIITPVVMISFFIINYFGYDAIKLAYDKASSHVYFSANALNLNWILTYLMNPIDGEVKWIYGTNIYSVWLFRIFYGIVFIMFIKSKKEFKDLLTYSMLGFLAYFIFNTGVHENHLLIPALLALLNGNYIVPIMANVNLFMFYGLIGNGLGISRMVFSYDVTLILAGINIMIFFSFVVSSITKIAKEKINRLW